MVFLRGFYGLIGISLIILSLNFIYCPDFGRNACKVMVATILYTYRFLYNNFPKIVHC